MYAATGPSCFKHFFFVSKFFNRQFFKNPPGILQNSDSPEKIPPPPGNSCQMVAVVIPLHIQRYQFDHDPSLNITVARLFLNKNKTLFYIFLFLYVAHKQK